MAAGNQARGRYLVDGNDVGNVPKVLPNRDCVTKSGYYFRMLKSAVFDYLDLKDLQSLSRTILAAVHLLSAASPLL